MENFLHLVVIKGDFLNFTSGVLIVEWDDSTGGWEQNTHFTDGSALTTRAKMTKKKQQLQKISIQIWAWCSKRADYAFLNNYCYKSLPAWNLEPI